MCLLCTEIQKKNMTVKEIADAFVEFDMTYEHTEKFSDELSRHYGDGAVYDVIDELLKKRSGDEGKA